MSAGSRPDRRRAGRAATRTQQRKSASRQAPPRTAGPREAPARTSGGTGKPPAPRRTSSQGSMLNALIIVLLIVLAVIAVALFVLLNRIGF